MVRYAHWPNFIFLRLKVFLIHIKKTVYTCVPSPKDETRLVHSIVEASKTCFFVLAKRIEIRLIGPWRPVVQSQSSGRVFASRPGGPWFKPGRELFFRFRFCFSFFCRFATTLLTPLVFYNFFSEGAFFPFLDRFTATL